MRTLQLKESLSIQQGIDNCNFNNRQNQEFVAALAIYEKVLPTITEPDDRISVLKNMILLYALRGEYEKAEELAQKQNSVIISRECLLIHAAVEEKRNRYEGEALLALLWQMTNVVLLAVGQRYRLKSSHTGIRAALAMIALYQEILDDGNYGFGHYAMASLYSLCARCAVEQGHIEEGAGYLAEYKKHNVAYGKLRNGSSEFHYTAPLVEGVTIRVDTLPPAQKWEKAVEELPEELKKIKLD